MTSVPAAQRSVRWFLQQSLRLLGYRGAAALAASVMATLALALVELLVAALIQTLLAGVGVLEQAHGSGVLRQMAAWPLWGAGAALVGVGTARFLCTFVLLQAASFNSEVTATRLRFMAVHDFLHPPPGTLSPNSLFQFRIQELVNKSYWATGAVTNAVTLGLQGLALLILMLATAWREALMATAVVLGVGLVLRRIQRGIRALSLRIPPLSALIAAALERVARNRIFVRLMRMEEREFAEISHHYLNYSRTIVRNMALSNVITSATPLLGLVVVVAVLTTSAEFWHTPGEALLLFLYLLFRLVQTAQSMVGAVSTAVVNLPQMRLSLEFVASLSPASLGAALGLQHLLGPVGATEHLHPRAATQVSTAGPTNTPPSLVVNHVSYQYTDLSAPVISGLSFLIPAGGQLVVLGRSGAGKSTLLMLMLGILRPAQGTVTLDGQAPDVWCRGAHGRIGYVGAEPFLVQGTLRENLVYGVQRTVTEEDIAAALQFASLQGLAGGLDRTLTDDMEGFSAGQKQRICLARALLNQPLLLILDEVSANLDDATEGDIARSIQQLKGRCTTIIVTHRRGMLAYADQVLELGTPAT